MNTTSSRNLIVIIVIAFLILLGLIYLIKPQTEPTSNQIENSTDTVATSTDSETLVRETAKSFVAELQKVSLLAPNPGASMEEFYGQYVAPELLQKWQAEPSKAPGRQTSSPWPDHLEIGDVEEIPEGFIVRGQIVYMTSNEVQNGGTAGVQDVTMTLKRSGETYLVTDYITGQFGRGGGS